LYQTPDLLSRSLAHIKNETNSHQERHNFPNFALSASNRKALGKRGMPTQVKRGIPPLSSRQASGFVKNLGSFWKQALEKLFC
jgi:hypothetical protein